MTLPREVLEANLRGKERQASEGWEELRTLRGEAWAERAIGQVRVMCPVALALLGLVAISPLSEAVERRRYAGLRLKVAALLLQQVAESLMGDLVAVDSGPVVAASNEEPVLSEPRGKMRVVR